MYRAKIGEQEVESGQPFILFSGKRGKLSEHCSLKDAHEAFQTDLENVTASGGYSDATIYEFKGWQVAAGD